MRVAHAQHVKHDSASLHFFDKSAHQHSVPVTTNRLMQSGDFWAGWVAHVNLIAHAAKNGRRNGR